MRRSARTKSRVVSVGIAVVALAVCAPSGAIAKKRHHGHGAGHGNLSVTKAPFGAVGRDQRSIATRCPTGR